MPHPKEFRKDVNACTTQQKSFGSGGGRKSMQSCKFIIMEQEKKKFQGRGNCFTREEANSNK